MTERQDVKKAMLAVVALDRNHYDACFALAKGVLVFNGGVHSLKDLYPDRFDPVIKGCKQVIADCKLFGAQ